MFEIGYSQGRAVVKLLEETGFFEDINLEKDQQDNDRIVIAKRLNKN
jgi:methylase of polypeptide subunit release factors